LFISIIGKIWKKLPPRVRTRLTRLTQCTFTVSVAGIITESDGRVLLLNHVLRPFSGWGLPGGFINLGEQPEAAFRREIREETGLEINDVSLYRVRTLKRHVEILFLATASGRASVISREIIELDWFDPDQIPGEMNLDQQFLIRKVLRPDV
jgi:8-oxo-dGTP diphosphatase